MATPYIPYSGPTVTRADALAAGKTRFYTGKPCKHGHLSERTSANGGCIACNAATALSLYYNESSEDRKKRNAATKAWRDANRERVRAEGRKYSREHREQSNAWKAANRDKVNAAEREARKRNPDIYKAHMERYLASGKGKVARKAYYAANMDDAKRRAREWKEANPDRVLEVRLAHYEANKEIIKQRVREWNEANPEGPRTRGRNYRARKYQAEGSHTRAEIEALLVKQSGLCAYCSVDITAGYEADHIQPLARGGSNWIRNIQLTCRPCNNAKRAIDPVEFARRLKLKAA